MDKIITEIQILPDEWLRINQFLFEMNQIKNQTISVYYPYGKGTKVISLLEETKRKEESEQIESEIVKRIIKLKTNPITAGKSIKTLCIFGWIENGEIQIKEIGTSKRLPYIYMESKKPYIKPINDILKTNQNVLVLTLDQQSAKIMKFFGSQIQKESRLKIDLQGRHKKGGQSQKRFLRARQTKIQGFFKKISHKIRDLGSGAELIIIGGNCIAKTEFFDILDSELKTKCRFAEGISQATTESKIHKQIIHHLHEYRKQHVSETIQKFEKMVKEGLTEKNNNKIYDALKRGAVDTLIVSADYHTDKQFKKILKMLEMANQTSSKIEFVTSPKIIEKLDINDAVVAILRYQIK